jgi:UDP:flavonoid glycosyltransferase YjiC (YdhE family)
VRVLMMPLAATSHYYAIAPLAWAFRCAGHDVRIASQEAILDPVTRSGMQAVLVGGAYDLLENLKKSETEFQRHTGRRLADFPTFEAMPQDAFRNYVEFRRTAHAAAAGAMADDLITFGRAWRPDLIVSDLAVLAGPLVAQVLNLPLVVHSWGLNLPPARLGKTGVGQSPELVDLYERFGADIAADPVTCTVHPCPRSLQTLDAPSQISARYVPYNGPGSIPDWLYRRNGKARVCVSWSLSDIGALGHRDSLLTIVKSTAELDVELIVTMNAADYSDLGDTPPNVRVVREFPLSVLAPTCAAAINHGGTGTVLTVAAYGVPQILAPLEQSQNFNAERLASVDAAISLPGERRDADSITDAVAAILGRDTWQRGAQRLREENDGQPAPAETVAIIEQHLAGAAAN